jgi:hypothetical protein
MIRSLVTPKPSYPRRKIAGSSAYRSVEAQVRLRISRAVGEMSIASLADAIELNSESVRRAMRSGTIPLEMVIRICSRFNLSGEWLLFGVGAMPALGRVPVPLPVGEPGQSGSIDVGSCNPVGGPEPAS